MKHEAVHVLCGLHVGNIFFSVSERDSSEIVHEIRDRGNFGNLFPAIC